MSGQSVQDVQSTNERKQGAGLLFMNADDWGRDPSTTDTIFECLRRNRVSCASGMVFMEDSERAADIARQNGFDIGLHLNFTTSFSDTNTLRSVAEHQRRIREYLRRSRLSECIFNPFLANSFQYSVAAQLDEYERLYGVRPTRLDGHHHKHLCANVVIGRLLPAGTRVRRNFSLKAGEKGFLNRSYRQVVDGLLKRRHQLTDYFFSIRPMEPARLKKILALSREFTIEVHTHPVEKDEFEFLTGDAFESLTESLPLLGSTEPRLI